MDKDDLIFGPLSKPTPRPDANGFGGGLEHEDPDTDALVVENMILSLFSKQEIAESFNNGDIGTLVEDGVLTENSIERLTDSIKNIYDKNSLVYRTTMLIAKERGDDRFRRELPALFRREDMLKRSIYEEYKEEALSRINEDKYMVRNSRCNLSSEIMKRCMD